MEHFSKVLNGSDSREPANEVTYRAKEGKPTNLWGSKKSIQRAEERNIEMNLKKSCIAEKGMDVCVATYWKTGQMVNCKSKEA